MGQTEYADTFVQSMFSWLRWIAGQITSIFQSNPGVQSGGAIGWFAANWIKVLIVLILAGIIIDWLVWMIRWRPYWLWFRKKRVVLDDDYDDYPDDPLDEYAAELYNPDLDELEYLDEFEEPRDQKLRFHSSILKKDRKAKQADAFDDVWDDDSDNAYGADDMGDIPDEFDEPFEAIEAHEGEMDDFDEKHLWGAPVEKKTVRTRRGKGKKFSFQPKASKKAPPSEPEEDDPFDDLFDEPGAGEIEGDMLLYTAQEETDDFPEYEAEDYGEADGFGGFDEMPGSGLIDDTPAQVQEAPPLEFYARPSTALEPVKPMDDEAWHTGYTVKTPKIDANTPGLSRKTRRRLRETEEE